MTEARSHQDENGDPIPIPDSWPEPERLQFREEDDLEWFISRDKEERALAWRVKVGKHFYGAWMQYNAEDERAAQGADTLYGNKSTPEYWLRYQANLTQAVLKRKEGEIPITLEHPVPPEPPEPGEDDELPWPSE